MNHLIGRRSALLAMLVLVVAACGNTTNPTASPAPASQAASPTATSPAASPAASSVPTPVATQDATVDACAASDLGLTGAGWSAAAGSRGTDVSVENRGTSACILPAGPAIAVLDPAGTVLLDGAADGADAGPTLEPGAVATFTALFSNWCDEATPLPLQLVLRVGSAAIPVPGLELTADDLPPCNGPGQPATLSANPWQVIGS